MKVIRHLPIQDVMIFESHSDFCDNSRTLFDYMISQGFNQKYRMIWLVEHPEQFKEMKIPNVEFIDLNPKSLGAKISYYYNFAVARFAFFSHRAAPFKPDRGEVFMNLSHGTCMKNTNFVNTGHNADYVLYTSDYFKDAYVANLGCTSEQLLPLGNTRNDLLFKKEPVIHHLVSRPFEKVLVWMPTYRRHKNGMDTFTKSEKNQVGLPVLSSASDLLQLNEHLAGLDSLLLIKLHPAQNLADIKVTDLSNIRLLKNDDLDAKGVSLYSMLAESDALISDYSSVYVDYLLTDKPIAFTVDDMKDYSTGFFFEDPLSYMPGPHINDLTGFKDFIADVAASRDPFGPQRKAVNDLFNRYQDGRFSERVVEFLNIN